MEPLTAETARDRVGPRLVSRRALLALLAAVPGAAAADYAARIAGDRRAASAEFVDAMIHLLDGGFARRSDWPEGIFADLGADSIRVTAGRASTKWAATESDVLADDWSLS